MQLSSSPQRNNEDSKEVVHSPEPATHKEPGAVKYVPKIEHIQEDLASFFQIYIENEAMLNNRYIKDEMYTKVKEGLEHNEYFALYCMMEIKLHNEGPSLLTKKDLISRGIRSYQNNARAILHKYEKKGPRLKEVKKLFIDSGMFTEQEIERELQRPKHLH